MAALAGVKHNAQHIPPNSNTQSIQPPGDTRLDKTVGQRLNTETKDAITRVGDASSIGRQAQRVAMVARLVNRAAIPDEGVPRTRRLTQNQVMGQAKVNTLHTTHKSMQKVTGDTTQRHVRPLRDYEKIVPHPITDNVHAVGVLVR